MWAWREGMGGRGTAKSSKIDRWEWGFAGKAVARAYLGRRVAEMWRKIWRDNKDYKASRDLNRDQTGTINPHLR